MASFATNSSRLTTRHPDDSSILSIFTLAFSSGVINKSISSDNTHYQKFKITCKDTLFIIIYNDHAKNATLAFWFEQKLLSLGMPQAHLLHALCNALCMFQLFSYLCPTKARQQCKTKHNPNPKSQPKPKPHIASTAALNSKGISVQSADRMPKQVGSPYDSFGATSLWLS